MSKHKALELAEKLKTDPMHSIGTDMDAAETIRAQHALIVQMREALNSCEAFLWSAGLESSDTYQVSDAALSAADQYLGDQA